MLGVAANTAGVIIGALIGLLFKKGINKRISDGVMAAVGMCVIYIGISGSLNGKNTLVLIISVAIGTLIGTALDIDAKFTKFAYNIETKFKMRAEKKKRKHPTSPLAEGFITSTLVFCIGAMAIVGPLEAGMTGDNTTLYIKAILDFTSSIIFASTLGIGVAFSSVSILVLEGGIALIANIVAPLLTEAVIAEVTCAGSVIIIALGLNMIGVTKFKIANFLPSVLLPIGLVPLYDLIESALSAV